MRRAVPILVACVALLPGCGGTSGDDVPSSAPLAAKPELAVDRVIAGNPPRRDVIVLAPSGKVLRTLVRGASCLGGVTWSPDGRRVAYSRGRCLNAQVESDIVVADATGANPRRLTETSRAFMPVWSPDGRTIAFAELTEGPRIPPTIALWSIDVETRERRRLVEPVSGSVSLPGSFSPDGSQLALTRWTWAPPGARGRTVNTRAVYLLHTGTLELRKLADRAAEPAFSPDGRHLAYVSDRDQNGELSYGDQVSYANELYLMDAGGGNPRRLTRTRDLNEGAPAWSPDAKLIALRRGEVTGNAEASQILTVRADGSCPRRVAFDPGLAVSYGSPAWRPGSWLSAAELACRPRQPPRANAVPLAGNFSLAAARTFRPFRVLWLGPRWRGFILSSMTHFVTRVPRGPGPVVFLFYGGVQLQLYSVCVRAPSDIDLAPNRVIRIRGQKAFLFEDGYRLELVTGKSTVVIFGKRDQIIRAARELRPITTQKAPRPTSSLPPPSSRRGCR